MKIFSKLRSKTSNTLLNLEKYNFRALFIEFDYLQLNPKHGPLRGGESILEFFFVKEGPPAGLARAILV